MELLDSSLSFLLEDGAQLLDLATKTAYLSQQLEAVRDEVRDVLGPSSLPNPCKKKENGNRRVPVPRPIHDGRSFLPTLPKTPVAAPG